MKGTRFYLLAPFLLAIGAAASCGPSFKSTMGVPEVRVGKKADASSFEESTYVYIDEFIDARPEKALAKRDKKLVNPADDVAAAAVNALKQALASKGFAYSESAPVIISGELREWLADVTGSLPTKVSANAAIYIEVLDPANKKIYSGVYRGFSSMEAASVNEDDVKKTLSSSMEEAVLQVAADKQLVNLLGSF